MDAPPLPTRDCATDEECDDGLFCNGAEQCLAGSCAPSTAPDCDDRMPCTVDLCSEKTRACTHLPPDEDADGHLTMTCGGDDCDDGDPNRYPGNDEVCDEAGHDEDCDRRSVGDRDDDEDGYIDALCCNAAEGGGEASCGTDCNDLDPGSHPTEGETCDGADNDCDGTPDDGVDLPGFADADGDLHGDPAMPIRGCPGRAGFSTQMDDCNDADPAVHGAQPELCDGRDNDCDGTADDGTRAVTWYRDADGDGFGSPESGTRISCEPVEGHSVLGTDCDDAARGVSPVAGEQCNGVDDDCNGLADFVIGPGNFEDDDGDGQPDLACPRVGTDCDDRDPTTFLGATEQCDGRDNDCDGVSDGGGAMAMWFPDGDGDGWGDSSELPIVSCEPQVGRVPTGGDCDDSEPAIHPGAADACDGRDEDCDGEIDETAFRTAFYRDADGDGVGGGAAVFACAAPGGHVARPGDCNDADATALPGAVEACDGVDDDCDAVVDEGAFNVYHADADGDGFGRMGAATAMACSPPAGFAPAGDCDETRATVNPMASEQCNRLDDDCDGTTDELPDAATACAIPGATASCSFGACTIVGCDAGRADCNRAPGDGCEIDLGTSPAHCGSCGLACSAGDACASSTCQSTPIVLVRASEYGTFALRASGAGAVWGESTSGVLGDGGTGVREAPVTSLRDDIADLALGVTHGCAVLLDGRVACWGGNVEGQLGDGTAVTRLGGVIVPGLADVVDVAVGRVHTCAVRSGGELWCWGANTDGQLGIGAGMTARTPTAVAGITDAVEVEAMQATTCVRHGDGRVSCWGHAGLGQVGDGAGGPQVFRPYAIPSIADATALARSSGTGDHICAVRAAGGVLCWGNNSRGQIGDGTAPGGTRAMPVTVTTLGGVAEVAVGGQTTCARRFAGDTYCWGNGDRGQLGDGGGFDATTATSVPRVGFTGGPAQGIAVGRDHACGLFESAGTQLVRCWGSNARGQFGNGTVGMPLETSTPQYATGIP